MIQQFQPTYESPSNVETERTKPMNNYTQANSVPKTLNTVEQMPFTIVTKVSPINNDTSLANHDKT